MEDNKNRKYQPPKDILPEHAELMLKIGIRLKELRTAKKLSSSGLAIEIGISRNKYHQMETGKVYFNLMSLLQVLDFHNYDLEEFFNQL